MSYLPDSSNYQITFVEKCDRYSNLRLVEVFSKNMCLILLHTMVPYYFTYHYGGEFQWADIEGQVDVQCPNQKGQVEAVILKGETISAQISRVGGTCAAGYTPGDIFNLTRIFEKICPLVFDSIFPWIQLKFETNILLRCPGCKGVGGKIFRIERMNEPK